jgi:hypothetical protein
MPEITRFSSIAEEANIELVVWWDAIEKFRNGV